MNLRRRSLTSLLILFVASFVPYMGLLAIYLECFMEHDIAVRKAAVK